METLHNFIKLTQTEAGKVFVVNQEGEVVLVVMSPDHYSKLTNKEQLKKLQMDVEAINQKILKAQLEEGGVAPVEPVRQSRIIHQKPGIVNLPDHPHIQHHYYHPAPPSQKRQPVDLPDLREEVIDPTFDFDPPAYPNGI